MAHIITSLLFSSFLFARMLIIAFASFFVKSLVYSLPVVLMINSFKSSLDMFALLANAKMSVSCVFEAVSSVFDAVSGKS